MSELKCYPEFPTTHGTASYYADFYMSIPHRYFFKIATVNYGDTYQDGDIVGMKVGPADKSVVKVLYRGKMDRESGVMDNCCSFLIWYQGKNISIKMFDNRFQICGTPGNDIDVAQIIADYVVANAKISQETVKTLQLDVVPDCIRESAEHDDFIGGIHNLPGWAGMLKKDSPIFIDIEIEDVQIGIDMLNHNFEIPFLFKQKPLADTFSVLPGWSVTSNNDKTTRVKLTYEREHDAASVKFSIDVGSGTVLVTGNCNSEVQKEIYHLFMGIVMSNYDKVVYAAVPKTVLYRPIYT